MIEPTPEALKLVPEKKVGIHVEGEVTYSYDSDGRLIYREDPTSKQYFDFNGTGGKILEEYPDGTKDMFDGNGRRTYHFGLDGHAIFYRSLNKKP